MSPITKLRKSTRSFSPPKDGPLSFAKFRKTVIIILLILTTGLFPVASGSASPAQGRWIPTNRPAISAGERQLDENLDEFMALPYLQGYVKASFQENVTIYDRNSAHEGLNFYVSGHAPYAGIMDMKGEILHQWTFDIHDIWPQEKDDHRSTYWRRAYLYDNGDLLAVYDGIGLIKLDKNSRLLWDFKEQHAHHHMQVAGTGEIYLLTRKKKEIPRIRKEWVWEDYIVVLNKDGKIQKEYSILESFENSQFSHLMKKKHAGRDIFHTNTIQILDGKSAEVSPAFKKGNILIACLYLNAIAIIDPDKNAVVWAMDGDGDIQWENIHEPVLLDNGNILLFVNGGNKPGWNWTAESRVIEFNPWEKKVVWQYQGETGHPFSSPSCGTSQRLANGNTLITESDMGRAFEVNPKGKIVWEYVNPHRAGQDRSLIATLLHLHRINPDKHRWLR